MSKFSTLEGIKCTIDHNILNPDTLPDMDDIGLSFFAAACGKNRGAFVVDPPDGHTYGCLAFPTNLAELSGATDMPSSVKITQANDIKNEYVAGNITATDTLAVLNFLVEATYDSSPDKATSPYACEISGLAKLDCPAIVHEKPRSDGMPIRSVTLAGLFVPALWATDGEPLTLAEAKSWYTADDFIEMKSAGLNTVQISVPTAAFTGSNDYGVEVKSILVDLMDDIESAGLKLIINLVSTADELDAVVAAGKFCQRNTAVVLGLTLPVGETLDVVEVIGAIRVQAPTLPLFVPMTPGDLETMNGEFDDLVFGSLDFSHTTTIADIASSSSQEDRSKLFYHEATACIVRSPLEFSACFQKLPIFLGTGFDLSIDDCVNKGIPGEGWKDYGQCDRFDETIESAWWKLHRQSLAARQVFAYEQGLGWSFATWKLYNSDNVGVLDIPAKLYSLQDVLAAGLFPDLSEQIPAQKACLNPPKNDFAMGDRTFAPTAGPPPDCGNGWWNFETLQCDYWIPPNPTIAPTDSPTNPCPACEICEESTKITSFSNTTGSIEDLLSFGSFGHAIAGGVVGGCGGMVVGALITWLILRRGRRSDYTEIPN